MSSPGSNAHMQLGWGVGGHARTEAIPVKFMGLLQPGTCFAVVFPSSVRDCRQPWVKELLFFSLVCSFGPPQLDVSTRGFYKSSCSLTLLMASLLLENSPRAGGISGQDEVAGQNSVLAPFLAANIPSSDSVSQKDEKGAR